LPPGFTRSKAVRLPKEGILAEPAKLLVFDEGLGGFPPWDLVNATCKVNDTHRMSSILNWLRIKTSKYGGKDKLYIMAHGTPGCVELGRDWILEKNVHMWGGLRGRLDWICICACSVANVSSEFRQDPDGQWFKGDGYMLCSKLAAYTKAYVTAADTDQQYMHYFGLWPIDFGSWEGNVYTWDRNGHCIDVREEG
jgi:hypothetical protein